VKFHRARTLASCCAASTAIAAAAALAQGPVAAPVEPPAKLAEYRDAFEKAVASRSAPARDQFASALQELARARAAVGDYEGAIRARDRRSELLDNSGPVAAAPAQEGEIVIDLPSGSRAGSGLKYDLKGKKIVGFTRDNQSIRWDLNKTKPGVYSALVTYSCGDPVAATFGRSPTLTGGSFTLEEATELSTVVSPPLRRTVLPTGGWNKTVTRNIGRISVTGSRMTLQLAVKTAHPGGLMHLYGIRLVPVSPDAATGSNPGDNSPAELASLRAVFRSASLAKSAPLVTAYGMRLRAMREALSAANDLEGAYAVQKEFIDAEKLSKDPTLLILGQPGS